MPSGKIKVTVHAEQGRDDTGRFLSAVETGAHASVMELAAMGANAARGAAPKRTGALAASIQVFMAGALAAGFGTSLPYAGYQEHGTGTKGRPGQFLTNREDFYGIGPVGPTPASHFMEAGKRVIEQNWRGVVRSNMP